MDLGVGQSPGEEAAPQFMKPAASVLVQKGRRVDTSGGLLVGRLKSQVPARDALQQSQHSKLSPSSSSVCHGEVGIFFDLGGDGSHPGELDEVAVLGGGEVGPGEAVEEEEGGPVAEGGAGVPGEEGEDEGGEGEDQEEEDGVVDDGEDEGGDGEPEEEGGHGHAEHRAGDRGDAPAAALPVRHRAREVVHGATRLPALLLLPPRARGGICLSSGRLLGGEVGGAAAGDSGNSRVPPGAKRARRF